MNRTESVIFYVSVSMLILSFFIDFPGITALTVFSFVILSLMYFFLGFALFNNIGLRRLIKKQTFLDISSLRILGGVGAGFSLSLLLIGILFKVMFWPGSYTNLLIGTLLTCLVLLITLLKSRTTGFTHYSKLIIRSIVLLIVGIPLLFISNQQIASIKYRQDPQYRNALINVMNEPENEQFQKELRDININREAE